MTAAVAAICLAGLGHTAAAEPGRTIAVLPPETDASLADVPLEEALREGLQIAGASLQSPADTQARLGADGRIPCADAPCFARLGERLGTTYLLRTSARTEGDSFWLTLDVHDAHTGARVARDETSYGSDLAAPRVIATKRAQVIYGQVATAALEPPPIAPPPPESSPAAGADTRALIAYGALGVGAGALALGVTWMALEGRTTNVRKTDEGKVHDVYRTKTQGLLTAAGGAAVLVTGALLLWHPWETSDGQVAVGVLPGGLQIAGRF